MSSGVWWTSRRTRWISSGAVEQRSVEARLGEAVGEEAHDRAGRQDLGGLALARGRADADRRCGARRDRRVPDWAEQDGRRVAGAGVGERARLRVEGGDHGRGEARHVVLERLARKAQRGARLESRVQVRAQRVAEERGAGQRVAAVSRHVAEHDAHPAVLHLEDVVEVAAGGGAVGRPVGHRDGERSDPVRHLRKQRGLQQADLGEELAALAVQPAGANRDERPAGDRRE
jgi:hypothetical protein